MKRLVVFLSISLLTACGSQYDTTSELSESSDMLERITRGAQITADAHRALWQQSWIGQKEGDLKKLINTTFADGGAEGSAFRHIVARGDHALELHYRGSSGTVRDGDLVLVDIGAKYRGYASDITRTFPANGQYTGRQRELYDLVLAAQRHVAENLVQGRHSINDANNMTKRFFRSSELRARDSRGRLRTMDYFFKHTCCHYVGRRVHGEDLGFKPLAEDS